MEEKHTTQVVLGGKVLTVGGYESEEYLQKVASYINNKIEEYNKEDSFKRLSSDLRSNLLFLNIADDYFKAKRVGDNLSAELEEKDKEIYDLKHELIAASIKQDAANKSIMSLQEEVKKYQKEIVRLETEKKMR
ncbi:MULTISPECIES: cell division protein ZapA [Lachnospira]|jgi:cell division protein ZapA|uniref:Cell division protein ZapA n=2 Tax=Lachnospira TaxID=28050 RepID=A0A1H5RJY5_9FIRM|nr:MULTISPECIES: cell division protein ZapA [Lachnospira]MCR5515983.1 cell division protein ZapA [Lachnospira sp.]SDM69384.1 cell division protein ZapA [Lachnospira pectinoschiza]SEF38666.1 cell division protein ZapA [Lachnospira multipara]